MNHMALLNITHLYAAVNKEQLHNFIQTVKLVTDKVVKLQQMDY